MIAEYSRIVGRPLQKQQQQEPWHRRHPVRQLRTGGANSYCKEGGRRRRKGSWLQAAIGVSDLYAVTSDLNIIWSTAHVGLHLQRESDR